MSNLSKALEKYYRREGRKVLFSNNQSLNQLAVTMWERLGLQQVDPSVLSRVIKGERLFTPAQVKVFCRILRLTDQDEEYLLACLEQDYGSRLNLHIGTTHMSPLFAGEVIEELSKATLQLFYGGDCAALDKRHELMRQVATMYLPHGELSDTTGLSLGVSLYFQGRNIANSEESALVVEKTLPICRQLLKMSQKYHSKILKGYAHILLSNAYYAAGGYSSASVHYKSYSTSVWHAKKAIDSLPEDNHERLFALRTMAASARYIHDEEAVLHVLQEAKRTILRQPKTNYINALHLSITLDKCLATLNTPSNPFSMQEFAADYFKRSLANTGIYEVSGIKEEIDTLLFLRSQDTRYIQARLKQGIHLANESNFPRQKKYFSELLRVV